jgi:hypothetical protein
VEWPLVLSSALLTTLYVEILPQITVFSIDLSFKVPTQKNPLIVGDCIEITPRYLF